MIINTNVSSLTAQEAATNTGKSISSSLEKLSTGLKINKASDDASGLAIADKLRTQATSIDQGVANGNSAVTLLQIADKSMAEQSNILDTVKAKLIQANTDTTSDAGRESIRKDIAKLLEQLDNIAEQTNYNGNILLQASASDTSSSEELSFQIGESNGDIISNTAIQSNTSGLGSQVVYSESNQNNTIESGSTTTLASTGTISLTSTTSADANTAETISLSGDVDSVALKSGMTISGMDATSQAALVAQAATASVTYTQSGNSFTMNGDLTLDLSAIDSVTASITTPAETAGTFGPVEGDIVTASTTNTGSALATALADNSKFTDNLDGTYTAKSGVAALTLEAGESVDYKTAATPNTFATGAVLTLTADAVAGSEFANALVDTNKFTYNASASGANAAGTSGAVYTATATAGTINIAATEAFTVDTPTSTGAISVGDYITTNGTSGNVNASSALSAALTDVTKFDDINGDGTVYKAIADVATIALESGESIDKTAAVKLEFGTDFAVGSEITITTADLIAGGDLSNQLTNTAKFDATVNGLETTYTVKDNFNAADLFLGAGEDVSIQASVPVTVATATDFGGLTPSALTLDGNAATVSGSDIQVGGVNQSAASQVDLQYTLTSTAANEVISIKAGDIISAITDDATNSSTLNEEFLSSGKYVDNGNNTYTATVDSSVTMGDNGDVFTVTRKVGSTATGVDFAAPTATTVDRTASTVTGSSTSENVTPSATVSVDVTTDSTLNATNNGTTTDTLTVTAADTNGDAVEVSNGGTQLTALADVGSGLLTADLASSFQAVIDDAITDLNGYRGDIGSTQNQVESAVRNLMTQSTNVKAAESIIRDVDYAQESATFNKQNIISQAGSYAISQANSVQQNVLKLLQ